MNASANTTIIPPGSIRVEPVDSIPESLVYRGFRLNDRALRLTSQLRKTTEFAIESSP
ncbi:hypothetical protein [Oscillatoria sp. FACHB-1406]|uniref:hypothetical protein n=1 Tax=Oscillatoria sp. FACHB-1406 TaxID=2692846 RepID=UPI00168918B3|nr:hypothetical protein [Oscillatoria sp. FACHB-1406]MBD2578036.1 hypothetical protein [Oscillatoria sp. FACHB-1406]